MAALSLVFDLIGRDVSASRAFGDVGNAAEKAGKKAEESSSILSKGFKMAGGAKLTSIRNWPMRLQEWMEDSGFLSAAKTARRCAPVSSGEGHSQPRPRRRGRPACGPGPGLRQRRRLLPTRARSQHRPAGTSLQQCGEQKQER